jgi:hypothetical protein
MRNIYTSKKIEVSHVTSSSTVPTLYRILALVEVGLDGTERPSGE